MCGICKSKMFMYNILKMELSTIPWSMILIFKKKRTLFKENGYYLKKTDGLV